MVEVMYTQSLVARWVAIRTKWMMYSYATCSTAILVALGYYDCYIYLYKCYMYHWSTSPYRLSQITAKNSSGSKCFRSLAFSADGRSLLAGGSSKFVCLYDVNSKSLLRKYALSNNVSLDG